MKRFVAGFLSGVLVIVASPAWAAILVIGNKSQPHPLLFKWQQWSEIDGPEIGFIQVCVADQLLAAHGDVINDFTDRNIIKIQDIPIGTYCQPAMDYTGKPIKNVAMTKTKMRQFFGSTYNIKSIGEVYAVDFTVAAAVWVPVHAYFILNKGQIETIAKAVQAHGSVVQEEFRKIGQNFGSLDTACVSLKKMLETMDQAPETEKAKIEGLIEKLKSGGIKQRTKEIVDNYKPYIMGATGFVAGIKPLKEVFDSLKAAFKGSTDMDNPVAAYKFAEYITGDKLFDDRIYTSSSGDNYFKTELEKFQPTDVLADIQHLLIPTGQPEKAEAGLVVQVATPQTFPGNGLSGPALVSQAQSQ